VPARRRYLACYDIRDPKRLNRMRRLMKRYGYPVQYSVFVCDLDGMELACLRREARAVMLLDRDSLVVIDLGAPGLGRFEFLGSRDLPPDGGAVII
jgi:CRISPR-associated protein Cas2